MKLHKIIITALLLGITINIVQAQEKTNPIQKDTLNPYLYADSARPYNQNPMTWDNYSEFKDKLEISDLIMKAENKKDYYKLFQISTLEGILNESEKAKLLSKIKNYAFSEKDPWLMFYLAQYIHQNQEFNKNDLNIRFIGTSAYTLASYRQDSELLRKIARLYTETNFMEGISYQEILEKANALDGGILPNYYQSRNNRAVKNEGIAISGNILNGKGKKRYTQKTEFADVNWVYEGDFVEGYENFMGNLYDAQGNLVYVGQWDKGLYVGNGRLSNMDGTFYEGRFLDGKFHGEGNLFDKEGYLFYSGAFEKGEKNGIGRFFYKDGATYYGEIRNGVLKGKGTYNDTKGGRYEGEFSNNLKNGKGKLFEIRNLLYYEGDFLNDEATGKGILYNHAEGSRLEGNFVKMQAHGTMNYILKDGTQFIENWEFGTKNYNTKDEIKLVEHQIALSQKVETCSEKLNFQNYTVEFPSKPSIISIHDSIKSYTITKDGITTLFIEKEVPEIRFISAENAQQFLAKKKTIKQEKVLNDNTFISNKKEMWNRIIYYMINEVYYAHTIYLDQRNGKTYEILHSGSDRKMVDKEHLKFKQTFVFK